MTTRRLVIAIDGPSGAGKGTVAREVALRLRYRHVDTGAMYRAVGWKGLHEGLDLDDERVMSDLAARATFDLEGGRVLIDGHDVSHAIRTPEMDRAATRVARLPGVREALVRRQRELGERGGIVMEGRDIGTVVFPDADVKIYLDADPGERARRRASDPAHTNGGGVAEVASALAARDQLDRTRAASPLKVADDAVRIDTTGVSIADVVARVMKVVEERGRRPGG